MSTRAQIGLEEIMVPYPAVSAANLALELKTPSDKAPAPTPAHESDDLDGCDVPVEHATSDEDLPASEGGEA